MDTLENGDELVTLSELGREVLCVPLSLCRHDEDKPQWGRALGGNGGFHPGAARPVFSGWIDISAEFSLSGAHFVLQGATCESLFYGSVGERNVPDEYIQTCDLKKQGGS